MIPFKFSEAYPFNIYGIAVVYSKWNSRGMIIDLNGNIIPKTNDYNFSHYYFYKQRFLSFSIKDDISDGFENEPAVGIYDTKERRVIVEPLLEDFDELNENLIRISEFGNHGISDFHEYYIDANGTVLFEGLKDKGFSIVGEPNKCNYSIVAINEYNGPVNADEGNTLFEGMSYILKRYYGVCSTDGEIIIPLDYDKIQELSENIFACYKNELITVFRI